MTRTREQIMAEWDGIRARIAGGCTNSGPRDWLEGVLDERLEAADIVRGNTMKWFTELSPLARILLIAWFISCAYSLLDKAIDVLGRCN